MKHSKVLGNPLREKRTGIGNASKHGLHFKILTNYWSIVLDFTCIQYSVPYITINRYQLLKPIGPLRSRPNKMNIFTSTLRWQVINPNLNRRRSKPSPWGSSWCIPSQDHLSCCTASRWRADWSGVSRAGCNGTPLPTEEDVWLTRKLCHYLIFELKVGQWKDETQLNRVSINHLFCKLDSKLYLAPKLARNWIKMLAYTKLKPRIAMTAANMTILACSSTSNAHLSGLSYRKRKEQTWWEKGQLWNGKSMQLPMSYIEQATWKWRF